MPPALPKTYTAGRLVMRYITGFGSEMHAIKAFLTAG